MQSLSVPFQPGTDLNYINHLARLYDFIFFIQPTDSPGHSNAFWGPLALAGSPQTPLSINMGPQTNVSSINFQYDTLTPYTVTGVAKRVPFSVDNGKRNPLSAGPAITANQPNVRIMQFRESGSDLAESTAKAQSQADASMDAIRASGEIDVLRYGDLLRARGIVWCKSL